MRSLSIVAVGFGWSGVAVAADTVLVSPTSVWDSVVQSLALLLSVVVVPWAVAEYRRRTGVQFTDQQIEAVRGAVSTGAGIIQTMIDQGHLTVADITPLNEHVRAQAIAALASVPTAATRLNTTTDTAARMIVARVNTAPTAIQGHPATIIMPPG